MRALSRIRAAGRVLVGRPVVAHTGLAFQPGVTATVAGTLFIEGETAVIVGVA